MKTRMGDEKFKYRIERGKLDSKQHRVPGEVYTISIQGDMRLRGTINYTLLDKTLLDIYYVEKDLHISPTELNNTYVPLSYRHTCNKLRNLTFQIYNIKGVL